MAEKTKHDTVLLATTICCLNYYRNNGSSLISLSFIFSVKKTTFFFFFQLLKIRLPRTARKPLPSQFKKFQYLCLVLLTCHYFIYFYKLSPKIYIFLEKAFPLEVPFLTKRSRIQKKTIYKVKLNTMTFN